MREKKVIICGGGTGGHLFPALALGRKLKENNPDIKITFVGGSRKLEKKLMQYYEADFIPLKIEGLKGMGLKMIKSLFILPFSFLKSFSILKRIKPHLVIGAGGYSSGPIVMLAAWIKIPTLIMEQNRHPGFTNRTLLRWAKTAAVAFENSLVEFKGKGIYTGNPVRDEFYSIKAKPRNSKLSILIFGGSQGSHFLNQGIINMLSYLMKDKNSLVIFHQTGEKDYEWVKNSYAASGLKNVTIAPFFHNMAEYFQKSDLIICRAGATTLSELIAAQKASLLVPFAAAADNHQTLNARELENIKGAEIILEEEFSPSTLAGKIQSFMFNKEKINLMEKNLSQLKIENSAERISNLCLELMENKT